MKKYIPIYKNTKFKSDDDATDSPSEMQVF